MQRWSQAFDVGVLPDQWLALAIPTIFHESSE
jgi:hypothetical protein